MLSDVHFVQIHLRAAQALIVLEAHAALPNHDDYVPAKDISALHVCECVNVCKSKIYLHINCINATQRNYWKIHI